MSESSKSRSSSSGSEKLDKKKSKKKIQKKSKGSKKPKWKRMLKKVRERSRERWKQFTTATSGSRVGQMFANWGRKHHLPPSQQEDAALLLQQQLEQYQADIERRKNRTSEDAGHLREGDTVLPYEQQALSMDWVNQVKPVDEPSSESEALPEAAAPSGKSPPSSSTSSTSEDSNEKTGQLKNLLMSMVDDAQKTESIRVEEENNLQLPPAKLAMLSRQQPDQFDNIITENTKQGLFLSQPNAEERQHWNDRRARPHHVSAPPHPVHINLAKMDKRIFCHTCMPRHVNYPHMKV